jgi:hypothetical protein
MGVCLALVLGLSGLARAADSAPDLALFKAPPAEFKGIHWVSLGLSQATEASLTASVRTAAQTGLWGSFMPGPGGGTTAGLSDDYLKASGRARNDRGVAYLSEDYFRLYRAAIVEGQKDNSRPSSAGTGKCATPWKKSSACPGRIP